MSFETIGLPLIGGGLIGLAAATMLAFNGKIAGISGIIGGFLSPKPGDIRWRITFTSGLILGGFALMLVFPAVFEGSLERSSLAHAVGGLVVGIGTRMGNGCASGHGVCGLGRRSPRSLVAVLVFITTGVLTVYITDHVLGGI